MKFKAKAMRAGLWFRSLPKIDRALIELTIKVKSTVRSVALANCLFAVMRKLEGLLVPRLSRAIREVGFPFAQKLSSIAHEWGNPSAKGWALDFSFMTFLAVIHINGPKGFRT